MQGVVLQSYGAGNGPDAREDLLAVFKEASDRGMMIVNITQCSRGAVMPAYAAGKVKINNIHHFCLEFVTLAKRVWSSLYLLSLY